MSDIIGKTVLITGATSGIGQATAEALAAQGARVLIACRNLERGKEVAESINQAGAGRAEVYPVNLASLDSVRDFAQNVLDHETRIDVLINNAGTMPMRQEKTEDGFEAMFGVNHLAHFLLTNLLLDRIKTSAPARIIHVSSIMHRYGKIEESTFQGRDFYWWTGPYGQSKLCNILFSNELARRLEGSNVTSNAVHPGTVATQIVRGMPGALQSIMKSFAQSAAGGAHTSIMLASEQAYENVTGEYFAKGKLSKASSQGQDEALAKWLWQKSEELCGLA